LSGIAHLLEIANISAVGQAQVLIPICLFHESAVEFEQPIQVSQVDGGTINLVSGACFSAVLQRYVHFLAEFKKFLHIQMRYQAIAQDLTLENASIIILSELFEVDFVESVQKRFGQRFSTTYGLA
jgi:hypothetical protein